MDNEKCPILNCDGRGVCAHKFAIKTAARLWLKDKPQDTHELAENLSETGCLEADNLVEYTENLLNLSNAQPV